MKPKKQDELNDTTTAPIDNDDDDTVDVPVPMYAKPKTKALDKWMAQRRG